METESRFIPVYSIMYIRALSYGWSDREIVEPGTTEISIPEVRK